MILEFSIANFLSFKDKVTFSMIANPSTEIYKIVEYLVENNT